MKLEMTYWVVIAALTVSFLCACNGPAEAGDKRAAEAEAEPPDEAQDEDETSDLDRSVSDLFSDVCEHGRKTYTCDECRYEVGVVKTPSELFEKGLLKKAAVEKRTVAKKLRLTGEIQYDERRVAHVSTQVDGIIRKVFVTLGDKVTKGQPLIEIDSVEIGQAKAAFQEASALELLARRNNQRLEQLRKEGISSEKEVLSARQELDAAQIRANAARGTLERLGMRSVGSGSADAAPSGRLVLRAPSDGTILGMHGVTGEVVSADESILTIGDNAAVWVWADLYERDFARVIAEYNGDALDAAVQVKAFPGVSFSGIVDFISPAMSESSRTVKVRVSVPNPEGKLLAGMFADVDLFLKGDNEALCLPVNAVLQDEGRAFVFVQYDRDYFVRRPVTLGDEDRGWVAIKSGLTGNETVAADGAFLLKSDVLRSKMGAGCAD